MLYMYVRPAKPQTSLRIFYDSEATDRTSFGVSQLKRWLHSLVWVLTCQNAALLEITCRGSNVFRIAAFPVCIHSDWKSLGHRDDCEIVMLFTLSCHSRQLSYFSFGSLFSNKVDLDPTVPLVGAVRSGLLMFLPWHKYSGVHLNLCSRCISRRHSVVRKQCIIWLLGYCKGGTSWMR